MLREHSQGLIPALRDMRHSRRPYVLAVTWTTLRRLQRFEAYVQVYNCEDSPRLRDSSIPITSLHYLRFGQIFVTIALASRAIYQRQKVTKLQYIHYGLRHLRNFNCSLRQLPFLRLRLKVCTGLGPLFCAQHSLLMKDVTEQWHNVEIVVAMAGCRYRARNRPAKSPSSHRSGGGDEYKEAY